LRFHHLAAALSSPKLQHRQQQQQQRRCRHSYQCAAIGGSRSPLQAPAASKQPAATACHLSGNSLAVTAHHPAMQQQQQELMRKTVHSQMLTWQMLAILQIQILICMI
jgi:hypothetical protein